MTIRIVRFVSCNVHSFLPQPPPNVCVFVWKRRFFLQIGLPSTRIRWKWSTKAHLFKNVLHRCFWKRWPLVYEWMEENEGFRIRWCNTSFTTSITHALWGMLSYFRCLAFSYGRAKTIRTRYVWTRIFLKNEGGKISFSKISGYLWTGPASLIKKI